MTFRKRILDMLPALVVFAVVSVFASYVTVAYIVHDPMWLGALSELRAQEAPDAAPVVGSTATG